MKLPIKDIVVSGDWLQCSGSVSSYTSSTKEHISARMKIISFDKVAYNDIDGFIEFISRSDAKLKRIEIDEGVLWLMRVELINTTNIPFKAIEVSEIIKLIDEDGFNFKPILDNHIMLHSKFSNTSGLKRVYGGRNMLTPKNKAVGAFMFQLPDDDSVDYFLTANAGKIELL